MPIYTRLREGNNSRILQNIQLVAVRSSPVQYLHGALEIEPRDRLLNHSVGIVRCRHQSELLH